MPARGRLVLLAVVLLPAASCGSDAASSPSPPQSCAELTPTQTGARDFLYFDYDAARASGALSAADDIHRLTTSDSSGFRTLAASTRLFDGMPMGLAGRAQKLQPTPYGPADARCVLSSRTDDVTADAIWLRAGGSVHADPPQVVEDDGAFVVLRTGEQPAAMLHGAERPTALVTVLRILESNGVFSANIFLTEDLTAAAVAGGSGTAVVFVWVLPGKTAAELTEMANEAIRTSTATSVDASTYTVDTKDGVAVLTASAADAPHVANELRARLDPVYGAAIKAAFING